MRDHAVADDGASACECGVYVCVYGVMGALFCAEEAIDDIQGGHRGRGFAKIAGGLAGLACGIAALATYTPAKCFSDLMDYYADQYVSAASAGMGAGGITFAYVITALVFSIPAGAFLGDKLADGARKIRDIFSDCFPSCRASCRDCFSSVFYGRNPQLEIQV